jgi:integrase
MQILPSSADCEALASFESEDDRTTAMWNAAVALMYSVGARITELSKIRWSDANRQKTGQWRISLRGGGARTVPVLTWSSDRLRRYEELVQPARTDEMMFQLENARFDRAASTEVRRRSLVLGISPVATPTSIRKACIHDLIQAGAALEDVADLVGAKRLDHFDIFVKSLFPREA